MNVRITTKDPYKGKALCEMSEAGLYQTARLQKMTVDELLAFWRTKYTVEFIDEEN